MNKTLVALALGMLSGCQHNLPVTNPHPHSQVIFWADENDIKRSTISSISCTNTDGDRNTACSIRYLKKDLSTSKIKYFAIELLMCNQKRGCVKIPVDDYGICF